MTNYFKKLGKSFLLPLATLPVAGILLLIGNWISTGGADSNNLIANLLITLGTAIIGNIGVIFAIGIAVGMSEDNDGTGALAGVVSWLMITTLLSPKVLALFKGVPVEQITPPFGKIEFAIIGIAAGLIGGACYNKFKNTKLPSSLAFFSGKRSVAMVTAAISIVVAVVLFFVWPTI